MTKENLLVRVLGSCETMANALAICSDKFQNKTTVFAGSVGTHTNARFARKLDENTKSARSKKRSSPNSNDLKAILYSKCASEAITPRCMRNVVVFFGPQLGQGHLYMLRNRQRMSRHRPASQQASQEGNSLTSPSVVSTRGQTASEMTPREVDRGISGQPAAPSRGQQQPSTVEICPRDPSNGVSSTQLQPYVVGSSPNVFHDDNGIVGNSPPSCESLPAADDSTGALCINGNGNGGSALDPSLWSHTANRAEGSTVVRMRTVVAAACSVSFFFFYYFYLHF